jgi:hypothetical protein
MRPCPAMTPGGGTGLAIRRTRSMNGGGPQGHSLTQKGAQAFIRLSWDKRRPRCRIAQNARGFG